MRTIAPTTDVADESLFASILRVGDVQHRVFCFSFCPPQGSRVFRVPRAFSLSRDTDRLAATGGETPPVASFLWRFLDNIIWHRILNRLEGNPLLFVNPVSRLEHTVEAPLKFPAALRRGGLRLVHEVCVRKHA